MNERSWEQDGSLTTAPAQVTANAEELGVPWWFFESFDALVGTVREIGAKVGVLTPNIDALLGLTRLAAACR